MLCTIDSVDVRMMVLCNRVLSMCFLCLLFKQKAAYEMRISDWSSDVCSSDLIAGKDVRAVDERPRRIGVDRPADIRRRGRGACQQNGGQARRSEERRVGKECVRMCRSRWSQDR